MPEKRIPRAVENGDGWGWVFTFELGDIDKRMFMASF
jgi:hypothetical protein